MKILAIETSTMLGGVAVAGDAEGLIAETRLNVKTTHSERLMTAVDYSLKQSGLQIGDIDVFAVATGPGSFTGLRIGLSAVKGLCFSTGKPLVPVPTLEAFAWNFPFSAVPVCLMLDARRGEVYTAVFSWEGHALRKLVPETSTNPEAILCILEGDILFAGEGAHIYKDTILQRMEGRAAFAPPDKMVPSPANVAILGLEKAMKGEFVDAEAAVPFYIRKSEAEVKWSEEN